MLAFITTLRHPDNSADYAREEVLLQETLASITQQTSDDYAVYIVANRAPSFPLPARTEFVLADFAPPRRANGEHASLEDFVIDKGSKVGLGLLAARDSGADWVMLFDADDFVHRDVVEFVRAHADSPGWFVNEGWVFSRRRNGYRKQAAFHRTCGTSYVIPFEAYGTPAELTVDASQREVVDAFGDTLKRAMGAHRNAVAWHLDQGRELRPLPFRGAVYHVDTGANHSGKSLAGVIRPWSKQLERDFAITSKTSRAVAVVNAVHPRAIAQWCLGMAHRVVRKLSSRRG